MDHQDQPIDTTTNKPTVRPGRRKIGTETVRVYGEILRQARKARGLSGEAMAQLLNQAGLNMSVATLYSIEVGKCNPTADVARLVAAVYGVPAERVIIQDTGKVLETDSVIEAAFERLMAEISRIQAENDTTKDSTP